MGLGVVLKKGLKWGVKKQHFVRGWGQKVRKVMLEKSLESGLFWAPSSRKMQFFDAQKAFSDPFRGDPKSAFYARMGPKMTLLEA